MLSRRRRSTLPHFGYGEYSGASFFGSINDFPLRFRALHAAPPKTSAFKKARLLPVDDARAHVLGRRARSRVHFAPRRVSAVRARGRRRLFGHPGIALLRLGTVDEEDPAGAGGIGEGQRIANLAHLYYVPFAPHMVASYLGAMAAAHVCASVPNFMILEWQIYYHKDPMWKEIVTFEGEFVEKGFIKVLDKPGIGVDINMEGMKKYAAQGMPFFE